MIILSWSRVAMATIFVSMNQIQLAVEKVVKMWSMYLKISHIARPAIYLDENETSLFDINS